MVRTVLATISIALFAVPTFADAQASVEGRGNRDAEGADDAD